MKIMAKTRFGLVYNRKLSGQFFKSQLKSTVEELNKFCHRYEVFMTAPGGIYCKKKANSWFAFTMVDLGRWEWRKNHFKDEDIQDYYFLRVHCFCLENDDE